MIPKHSKQRSNFSLRRRPEHAFGFHTHAVELDVQVRFGRCFGTAGEWALIGRCDCRLQKFGDYTFDRWRTYVF